MTIKINYNPQEDEKKEQEKWFGSDLYYWDKSKPQDLDFVIDTPPPTVSGVLHMGHVFSYCQTDFVARYQRMCGKNVFYPIGFDDNGLPTERLVEKTHNVKGAWMNKQGKKQEFIDLCYGVVENAEKEFEKLFKTLGISYDWRQKYQTISKSTNDLAVETYNKLKNAGLIEQRNGAVYWDVVDQTALAQSIIEDKEVAGAEHYLEWDIFDTYDSETPTEQAVIMTTRPELLPACVAVFYNPDDSRFTHLKGKFIQFSNITNKVPCLPDEAVRIDKGTGLVMCCTYGDWQDVEWVRKHNLKSKIIVDKEGRFENSSKTHSIKFKNKVINYTILNPARNYTALITDIEEFKTDERIEISHIIQKQYPDIEQVCFLTIVEKNGEKIYKNQMENNEFCGNATRAFASYLYNSGLEKEKTFKIMCSGNDNILLAYAGKDHKNDTSEDSQKSYFILPINKKLSDIIEESTVEIDGKNIKVRMVKLDGVTHTLIDINEDPILDEETMKQKARFMIKSLKLDNLPAAGMIWFDKKKNQIHPFIWINGVDTLYYENACGSGSLAYGLYCAQNGENFISVQQKNENDFVVIDVDCSDGFIKSASIGGITELNYSFNNKKPKAIEARKYIIEKIQAETPEKIKEIKPIKHMVKVGERSKEPVEIIESTQLYVKTLDFKEDLLVLAKYVNFHPAHLKNRLIQWIEGLNQDWCISRDRFFGIEIPDNGDLQQVFDTWFTSSSSPYVCRENERLDRSKGEYDDRLKNTTALRPQAHEIIRTWTFSTMLKTYLMALIDNNLLEERAKNRDRIADWLEKDLGEKFIIEKLIPWKDVMLSGWCLAKDGAKMSKSAGNVITPTSLIQEKGSDIVRYWAGSCSLGVDTAFNETKFLDGKKLVNKLLNATKFATMHFERQNLQTKSLAECVNLIDKTADKWIVSRLVEVIKQYQKAFNEFEYSVAKNAVERLFWDEYCDNYLEIVKSRAYADDLSALATLRVMTEAFLLLFAPYVSHLTSAVYREIFNKEVHKCGSFAELFAIDFANKQAVEDMKIGLEIINFVRQKKADLKVSIKAPIKKLAVKI